MLATIGNQIAAGTCEHFQILTIMTNLITSLDPFSNDVSGIYPKYIVRLSPSQPPTWRF